MTANDTIIKELKEKGVDGETILKITEHLTPKYGLIFERTETPPFQTVIHEAKEIRVEGGPGSLEHHLIEGDNLHALQHLQATHRGLVDVIYIDPPYNTQNRDFIYNDHYVDKEDAWRHSKWLSFMSKRLVLARELLTDEGVLLISIDDNEMAQLKLLCDQTLGEKNFVLNVIVNRPSEIATNSTVMKHEYVLVYAKNIESFYSRNRENSRFVVSRGTVGNAKQTMPKIEFPAGLHCYNMEDGVHETTRKIEGSKENIENFNDIVIENGKLKYPVTLKAKWRSSNDMRNFFKNNCKPTKAKISGEVVEIYFENDRFNPQIKKATSNKLSSLFLENKKGSLELKNMGLEFTFPKSTALIKTLLKELNINKTAIILDFFAGSGTTGHAVMSLNEEDGGNRQFILCTNNENNICEEVTYERLKRVINGYTTPKKKEVAGLAGNSLRYWKVDATDI